MRNEVSVDSEPEPVKKTWLKPSGVTSARIWRDSSIAGRCVVLKKVL